MSDPGRELQALLGSSLPVAFTREHRVRLLGECARALLRGELPSAEARLFTAGGLIAWLEQGGNLCRDFWRVTKPKSHHTPAYIWRVHHDERQGDEADDRMAAAFDDNGEQDDAGTDEP